MKASLIILSFLMAAATSARCDSAGEKASFWFAKNVLRNQLGCEPPPYIKSQTESLEELSSDVVGIKRTKNYDHCRAAEKEYEMTYQLSTTTQDQAIAMGLATVREFQDRKDYDNAVERAIEFLRLFGFSNNDSNPLSEDLRFTILESTDRKIRSTGPYADDNMREAALDFHVIPNGDTASPDYRYFSYDKFLKDFPNGQYASQVAQMRQVATDSEISRQESIADNNEIGSARARIVGIYSIPGAEQSRLLPKVILKNAEDDIKIIQLIEKIQSKAQHESQSDRENLDRLFSQFHLLFDGNSGFQDPQKIIDFLKNDEFPKLRLLMKAIPNDQEQQDDFDALPVY